MGFVDKTSEITHILVVSDPKKSSQWYQEILGAEVFREFDTGAVIKVMGNWFLLTEGGESTEDKPNTVLTPPKDHSIVSSLFTIRVKDCNKVYNQLKEKGANFLTPPIDHGHEIRCFFADLDSHVFEISEIV